MSDRDCWPAMPSRIVVTAPPTRSCPIGTFIRLTPRHSTVSPPMRSMAYRTTAACDEPTAGVSTSLVFPASPSTAMVPKTKNAAMHAAVTIL